jgi:hypothetical protein
MSSDRAHGLHISDEEQLVGRFNGHLDGALFPLCDEAFFGKDPAIKNQFKSLVTVETLLVEEKFQRAREVPNRTKLVFASNDILNAIPLEDDDRRSTLIEVSNRAKQNREYFCDLDKALAAGGRSAFLAAMLARDISAYNPRLPYRTSVKQEAQRNALGPADRFWLEAVESGVLPGLDETRRLRTEQEGDWHEQPVYVLRSAIYSQFQGWCRARGVKYPDRPDEFGRALRKLCGGEMPENSRVTVSVEDPMGGASSGKTERARAYRIPPLAACREYLAHLLGDDFEGAEP